MAIQDILNKLINEPLMFNMRQHIVNGLEQVYKDATAKGDTNMEVLRARGSNESLNDRLDFMEENQSATTFELSQKASINYVDAILMDIAKGGPNSGPSGPFMSIAALYSHDFPDGKEGTWLVFDSSFTDGAHSFMWDTINVVWKDLGIYQAKELANGSVDKKHLAVDLITESETFVEDNLSKVFDLHNKNFYHPWTDLSFYNSNFGAVKEITLIGFDKKYHHRLRLISRNHPSFKYRFIICRRPINEITTGWVDVFDSGSAFDVAENLSGLTNIEFTQSSKTVKMKIDYGMMASGLTANDGALASGDGRYRLKESCFYENKIESVKKTISRLESDVGSLSSNNGELIATKEGSSYKIKFKYSETENMVLEFNKLGINELIHPKKIYKETSETLTSDFQTPVLWNEITTDWVSPYYNVAAVNGTTSFNGTVGGNHGTNGSAGFPTARNLSAKMYVDEREILEGETVYSDKVTLVVTNSISASNHINVNTGTKSDSLEEVVTYTITPNNIEVSVYLTALESLSIQSYVGLQMTTNMLVGEVHFNDSANKYSIDGIKHDSLSKPFDGDRMVYANSNDLITTYTNRNVGLGNLSKIGTAPIHYSSAFNKLYSHLLGETINIAKNGVIYYSGGYTIMKPLECLGSESAYFIKTNGIKEFCVDFLSSVSNAYLKIGSEFIGKEIEVINKSESISCDSIISGKGLRISASDFGNIKFRIKQ